MTLGHCGDTRLFDGAAEADSVLERSGAKVALPHHYAAPETAFYTSTLEPATEWAETHEHTMPGTSSIQVSPADLEGKKGHVMYFGSHNAVTEGG